jgi:hypothetical protein
MKIADRRIGGSQCGGFEVRAIDAAAAAKATFKSISHTRINTLPESPMIQEGAFHLPQERANS